MTRRQSQSEILAFLRANPGQSFRPSQLVKLLDLSPDSVRNAVWNLTQKGRVQVAPGGFYSAIVRLAPQPQGKPQAAIVESVIAPIPKARLMAGRA